MFRLISYIKYIIFRMIKFCLLICILLVGASLLVHKIMPEDKTAKIIDTTSKQAQLEHKTEEQVTKERQEQFKADDEARIKSEQRKRKANARKNSVADDIWTDDNNKNVVQPHIDEEQQKLKNHADDSVYSNPTASGKSFLGDDLK